MSGEPRQPSKVVAGQKPRIRWGRHIAGMLAVVLAMTMLMPIVIVALVGRRVAKSIVPKYANTLQRVRAAEVARRFIVPSDSSITPIRAGEAMMSLGAREGTKTEPVSRRAARGPYSLPSPDPTLFPDARPIEWKGPSATKILAASQRGFSREEMDYLNSLAANPIWEEYSIVARAPRMDLAGAFYKTPFPDRFSVLELPIMKFAATKEVAYANVSRAARHLANRHADSAEYVLRETISNGFRIIDDGNMLIDALIGVVVVGIGESGLEQFYEITKNPELDRLRSERELIDRTPIPAAQLAPGDEQGFIRAVTDTTLPRGLRFELVQSANLATCTTLRGLFSGASGPVADAMETARGQLVRTPAEGDLFDLSMHVVDSPSTIAESGPDAGIAPRVVVWMARVPAWLLRNPRMVNCAAAFTGGLARSL
jgi:hypothetical protein